MEDDTRPTKKRKLFQELLPAEMIENILLYCTNTITLESLACTCKQINALVSNILKKSIIVRFQLFKVSGNSKEKTTAEYVIKGNGCAIKKTKFSRNSREGMSRRRLREIQTIQQKLEDRAKVDKLISKLLNIMNMTDKAKLKELFLETIIARKGKYKLKWHLLFSVTLDKVLFDVQVDTKRIRYTYKNEDISNGKTITSEEDESEDEDPDLDTKRRENWWNLDELMTKRLKCSLCALKVKKFYKKIRTKREFGDKVIVRCGNDEISHDSWELYCFDTGYVNGRKIDWTDRHWDARYDTEYAAIQYRPSLLKHVLKKVGAYIRSKVKSTCIVKKLSVDQSGRSSSSRSEIEDEEENNYNKCSSSGEDENDPERKNKDNNTEQDEEQNDKSTREECDKDKSNEKDEQRDKKKRCRVVEIELNGTQYSYREMSNKDLAGLMDTLALVTLPLSLNFEY